nr:LysR substrate-binding domain-containing protein [uncultured Aminipila sp.]
MPYIRTVLHDQRRLSERIGEINGLREGLIRIGTFNSVSAQWLPGMIKRFQHDYPGIRFELLHGTDTQIVSWIADGRVDVGFVAYPTLPELESEFLYRDPIVGIFSEDDPYSRMEKLNISELPNLPYIALNEGVEDEITAILDKNRITLDARFVESDDGGVYSSLDDLYKWDKALYTDALVSKETLKEAYSPQSKHWYNLPNFDPFTFDFGWYYEKNNSGDIEQNAIGETQGFATGYIRMTKYHRAIIVLSNKNNNGSAYDLHRVIRKIYGFDTISNNSVI